MVKPRARTTPPTEAEIEAFGNQAEQPRRAAAQAAPARRIKEPKSAGYTFRMTERQKRLLTLAADAEDISEQKLLERLVWPALVEKHGEQL